MDEETTLTIDGSDFTYVTMAGGTIGRILTHREGQEFYDPDRPVALTGDDKPLGRKEAKSAPLLQVVAPVFQDEDAILQEARAILGYRKNVKPKHDKKLYDVLAELELSIYDTESVRRYQRWILRKNGAVVASRWERTNIENYKDPIPKDALRAAIEVKKALPDATVEIESYKHDPFMRVRHNNCTVYIAVWDEPDFDGCARIAGRD